MPRRFRGPQVSEPPPAGVRSYAADVAYFLNTPLPAVLAMPFDEIIRWGGEAARLAKLKVQT